MALQKLPHGGFFHCVLISDYFRIFFREKKKQEFRRDFLKMRSSKLARMGRKMGKAYSEIHNEKRTEQNFGEENKKMGRVKDNRYRCPMKSTHLCFLYCVDNHSTSGCVTFVIYFFSCG